MNFGIVLGAVVLAAGIAGAGYLVGDSLITSKQPLRTVTVKGLSERAVEANLGFWPIRFVATGATLEQARTSLETSETAVNRFLEERGFAAEEIQVQNVLVEDRAAGYNAGSIQDEYRFVLTEDLLVTTDKVQDLAAASREVADLLRQGVVFSADAYSAGASFVFTGINDLKSEMLTEATQRAKDTAAQFATESGANVGTIQSANQGVFEILPAVEIPNDRPEKQIDKKVRVVTTITYSLVN
ncbi:MULTISPECIES: SIMPL domain-containing protein [unclassified Devosia]|uniref:SIMPL domain-containing protein n=1 Tax=unclassified Devosia TaxID=196773 RepID=UPI00145EC9EC|nr:MULTISPECIES: SIMPL domain-containing protein [unclassified Devosia]MBJ6989093.1 SIMPL domain-containing protein [Devosia sp. MC521]QMW62935.1 SIMPL domain-containing protein [Devosia sp. MC521]